jgi:hypothetical protein
MEISDETASLYERSVPIEYKRPDFRFQLPTGFKTAQPNEKKEEETQEEVTNASIMKKLREQFQDAFSEEPPTISSGEKSWYKHANHVMEHLKTVYDITQTQLETFVVDHMLDMLLFHEKKILVESVYGSDDEDPLVKKMAAYCKKRKIEKQGKKAFVFNKENGWKLFLWKEDSRELIEAEPEDYRLFESEYSSFIVDVRKINKVIGFVNLFKNNTMVFKIKDITQTRNNTGARCGDSTTKADAIKLTNLLLNKNAYDNTTVIMHYGICVIVEVLMRHFTAIEKDDKIYYLTPEQTVINNIAKFSKA